MRKYSGMLSIFMLVLTFLILQSLVGKDIGPLWVWIILVGYVASAAASWYSESGFWKKASSAILIVLPISFVLFILAFVFALRGHDF
ncbi:hypothetical protein LCM10_05070 [Rossellomorea aquimaris]|uniref:hypothetical protein n=1 Tax=Rossellomorea aquimaris TaxID=189382 RepID=UPI001CD7C9F6|nr:hypothetical protein [Rossellomorea aquimaris]MCA1054351.1 hypothetical protein [Rossellomorea aquimaris]